MCDMSPKQGIKSTCIMKIGCKMISTLANIKVNQINQFQTEFSNLPDDPTRGVRGMASVKGLSLPMAPKMIPEKYMMATLKLEWFPTSAHSKENPSTICPITLLSKCHPSL